MCFWNAISYHVKKLSSSSQQLTVFFMTDHSCPVTRGKFQRSPLNLILPVAIQTSLRNPNTVPPFYLPGIHWFIGGSSWSWLYGSWIYNYLCNQCLSPLTLGVRIPLGRGVLVTTLCDKVCQWHAAGRWFSLGTPVSTTNKTDHHDITEILLKVVLNTITLTLIQWLFILT